LNPSIPAKYFTAETIASNQIYILPEAPLYVFSILSSSIHMSWIKHIGGRLKSDYRYSSSLCYNTFPAPALSEEEKSKLSEFAILLLSVREEYPEKTLANLYDPELMPENLQLIHTEIDQYVETIFAERLNEKYSDQLELLLKLYLQMTGGQNA
jgi:hypothetical protein